MADFIAKLGLDAKDFVAGLETAAQKAGVVTQALQKSADDSKGLASGLNDAGKAADGLVDSTGKIEDNLAKAGSGGGALDGLTSKFKEGQAAASAGGGIFGDVAGKLGQLASPVGAATAAIGGLTAGFASAMEIGQEFEQNLAGVSAVTGLTGPALDDIGNRARELSKRFGGEASTQLQAFQGVLSKFGAQLAETPDQLGKVSENINILAKAGGLDAKEAMDTLANSMLQFGVNVSDGNEAASESSRFINVLAASARVGAAEIPQVGQAVLVAGVAAKGAKVSFEETNAAIQVLAAGGKVGAEAGIALRNVLGKIAGEEVIPKPALDKLKSLGVDMSVVSDTSLSLSDRLKELSKASSDATAFAQVFGTENAAAASILASGADTISDWTKEITGTQDATTQAAVNMNTLQNRFATLKSTLQDALISAFQKIAPALSFVIDNIGTIAKVIAPVVIAFGTMAVASKAYAIAQGAVSIATGIYETVTGTATIATTAFGIALNTATGGVLLIVGAVAALIAGYVLFTDTAEEAAQASLKQAEEGKKVVESQIKDNEAKQKGVEATKRLADRYQELAQKTNLTKKEQDEMRDITAKLDKQYPDLIDQTKSFGDNLAGVAQAGKQATADLKGLKTENDNLQKSLAESNKIIIGATRNVAIAGVDTAVDEIYRIGNAFNSQAAGAEAALQRFGLAGKLQMAKNDAEIENIKASFMEQLNKLQSAVGDQNYLAIAGAVTKAVDATKTALKQWSGEVKAETQKSKEDVSAAAAAAAPKAEKKGGADDADKKAAEASKKLLDEKKNLFETEKSILENQSQQTVEAIQQKAIAENRKLTQSEQADILREEIALIDRIAEKRREVFNISGQGKDLKTALKLTAKDAQDIQDSVRDAQTKAGEAEVKLRFSIINLGEAQVKEQIAFIARTAKTAEENLKKDLSIEFFAGINQEEASAKIAAAVKVLKDKAAEATALGDKDTAEKILTQARELEEKLTENAKKGNEKRLKDAEENRKKDLQLKLEAIDNEKARTIAKQIIELAEKKREILASDRGTAEERAKIAARYQREIDELAKGTDKSITDQRAKLAREEAELVKSLNARKISYEEYNKRIAEIQSQSSEIDKQVDANKKAAQEVSDALGDIVKPAVKPIEISVEGAAVAFTNALDFYNSLVNSGEKAKDALDKTFQNLKDSINANFDEIAAKAAKALQFDNVFDLKTLTSNTTEAATIISAAFAKAKNNGKRDSDAYKEALQATNQAIAASLGSSIDKQTAKFNELRDKGEATYTQVAEIALLSLGKAAVEGKNLAKESLKIVVESALKMIEINLVTILTAFGITGPTGLLAGIAVVATLRGLAAAAFANAGYKDGGYTGNAGTSDVAGVVHGQEFVHTADVTRRYRPLFEHLHKGGELSTWAIGVTGQLQTQNQPQPFVSTYGIETRLERLESAIVKGNRKFESMRAVQMTVEHDPSIIIKTQNRNLAIRSARA